MTVAMPEVRLQLAQARNDQMAQVVALVDALPQRGHADALIAPLRPRLALLPPCRPMTLLRLMFTPLDAVIVPGPQWRPGTPAVPRTALDCLGQAAADRLGAAGAAVQGLLGRLPPGDADGAARVGAVLWPAAAAVLDKLPMPPDWCGQTGLPPDCFGPLRTSIAAVLHQASRLARLDAAADSGSAAASVGAVVADTQARSPGGLATVLAVLLAHGPAAAVLTDGASGRAAGGLASLPLAALEEAGGHSLDRADDLLHAALPGVGLRAAAGHADDVAALVDALERSSCRAKLRAQAGQTRIAADQACRNRLSQAMQQDVLPRVQAATAGGAPLDDDAVAGLEATVRDLRRLGRAGRRCGQPAAYDTLLHRIAAEISALQVPGLTCMDRLRLAELLVGAQAALRLVLERVSS